MYSLLVLATFAISDAVGPKMLCLADWGGLSDKQPTTAAQITTASGMAKVAKELSVESIMLLGDNFYDAGVLSIDSKRFNTTFGRVYTTQAFGNLPFHVIAGNHDHLGNVSAQVQYSSCDPRWHYPSLYYNLHYNWTASSGGLRTVQMVMIDTPILAGYEDIPANATEAEKQWSWIEHQLRTSRADYLFVAGHYPIYSAGDHGNTPVLVQRLLPLMSKYGAHYVCAHDHLAQHIISDGVHQFANGMGRECCDILDHVQSVPAGQIQYAISGKNASGEHIGAKPPTVLGGFNSMDFGDDVVTITYYQEDGVAIYTPPPLPRRNLESVIV